MKSELTIKQIFNQEQTRIKKKIEFLEKGTILLFDTKQKAQQVAISLDKEWDTCNGVFMGKQDIGLLLGQIEDLAGNYLENFCLAGTFSDLEQDSVKFTYRYRFL